MDDSSFQQQEAAFKREEEAFRQAQARYQAACEKYQCFKTQERFGTPPLARAVYSDRMAWTLAVMSKLAYVPFEKGAEERARLALNLQSGGFELLETFQVADTQAFLAKHAAYAVLAFRGTEVTSLNDIITDLQVRLHAASGGKVHTGFYGAYDVVAGAIENSLPQVGQLPLYITGHSLGGALATIATQRLEHRINDQIAACYTFGSPRVGDADYDTSIKAAIYRVVNGTDIVTLLPPLEYRHIGDVRYMTRGGRLRRGMPLTQRVWDFLAAMVLALPRLWHPWVAAHKIDEYIQKLEKVALERNKR